MWAVEEKQPDTRALFSLVIASSVATPVPSFLLSMALLCDCTQLRMPSIQCLNRNSSRVWVLAFFFSYWNNWFHMVLIPGWSWCGRCSRHCWCLWSWWSSRREGCCWHTRRKRRKGTTWGWTLTQNVYALQARIPSCVPSLAGVLVAFWHLHAFPSAISHLLMSKLTNLAKFVATMEYHASRWCWVIHEAHFNATNNHASSCPNEWRELYWTAVNRARAFVMLCEWPGTTAHCHAAFLFYPHPSETCFIMNQRDIYFLIFNNNLKDNLKMNFIQLSSFSVL